MRNLLILILFCLLSICHPLICNAQPGRTEYLNPNIHTLQLKVDEKAEAFPVLKLNSGETLNVSFDDLTHEYRRYTYKIEHCNAEGNISDELFESEYVNCVDDEVVIDDYEQSENTTVLYTHYTFSLPNAQMRPLLSGNYRITVSTENNEGEVVPVLRTYFGVVDTRVSIYPTCSANTEVDWNSSHQQLSLRIDASYLALCDAENEVKVVVMQNRRLDNAVINPRFTAQNGNSLLWEHNRDLIFEAGNEYRKMEIISTRYPGMHGEGVRWIEPYYHYTIMADNERKHYLYDEDRNGLYLTRYDGGGNADVQADYVLAHFSLNSLPMQNAKVYISGQWTCGTLNERYAMRYEEASDSYVADVLLKCGYYNYLYLTALSKDWKRGTTAFIEGNYYQTENEYDILVYYRPTGSRYWQLVGCVTPIYRKQ